MLEQLLTWDRDLLIYLNSLHADWLDPVMMTITQTLFWVPLYLFLVYLIIKDYRNESWLPLIGIFITIILADQVTASIMKPFFQRLRPSREPSLVGIVHLVDNYTGGLYGFASSHAANTFGTATFFWMLFGKTRKWILVLFVWAAAMTYSRIYLGVHYPGDILVGASVGVLSAFAGYRLFHKLDALQKKRKLSGGTQ